MKRAALFILISTLFAVTACHSRKPHADNVPPLGYYATRADAQAFAGRLKADVAKSRTKMKAGGVRAVDLPCARYLAVSTKDSDGHTWWGIRRDMSGCPAGHSEFPNPLAQPTTGGKHR